MIVYAASGHSKVIISCLEATKESISCIYDDNIKINKIDNYPVSGIYEPDKFKKELVIIGIGDNKTRKKVSEIITHAFGKVIHPSAIVDNLAIVDYGTVVFHNVIIQRGAKIGKHVIINTSASVDHDCLIDDYVHISPNAALGGNVTVGEGTHIGIGASVIQGVKIGKWCKIGAGSVIINDIPDNSVVVGVPGKIIKNYGK